MTGAQRVLDPNERYPGAEGLCALAIMTKAPRAGQVKTRLTPPLTPEEAALLNVCFLRDTAAAIAQASSAARGIGCYTPIGSENVYREILPRDFALLPQRGDDFGERLFCATADLLSVGFDSVCLIDSDSPTVPPRIFCEAVNALTAPDDQIVLGPSKDGGYYLIGLKQRHRRMFQDIEWSSARVYEQTVARAGELKLSVHLLPTWYDVDDRATLDRLSNELLGANGSGDGFEAPATRQFLQRIEPSLRAR
jgi:rSAM/selenodomain-associated transferase 1